MISLSGSSKKTAHALKLNVARLIEEAGIASVGFLTLTVGGAVGGKFVQVWSADDASARIHKLMRRFLPAIMDRAVIVTERHASGAIHFHLVGSLVGRPDIRTGFDFDAVKLGNYSSVPLTLRKIWAVLRRELPAFGFGRAELTPIRKTGDAIAAYVAAYVAKSCENRCEDDHGRKLVRYMGWGKRQLRSNDFSWCSPGASRWRRSAARIAALAGIERREDMSAAMGPRWAFVTTRIMNAVASSQNAELDDLDNFGTRECARAIVGRVVRKRWIRSNELRTAASPVNFHWRGWRSLTVRRQCQLVI